MTANTARTESTYDPNRLLDALKDMLKLDSDLALSQALDVPPPVISQIRHRGYPVGPSILIRMHDLTSLSVRELRAIMGDRRSRIRSSYDVYGDAGFGGEVHSRQDGLTIKRNYLYALGAFSVIYGFWYLILR